MSESYQIERLERGDNLIDFKTTCACGCDKIDMHIFSRKYSYQNDDIAELDDYDVELFFKAYCFDHTIINYSSVSENWFINKYCEYKNFLKRLKFRIINTFKLIFTGKIEYEFSFIFENADHAKAFGEILINEGSKIRECNITRKRKIQELEEQIKVLKKHNQENHT